MKVELRGQHQLGGIVGYAYRIYARNFAVFFGIALLTVPLQMLGTVVQDRASDAETGQLLSLPFQILGALVTLLVTGAIIHAVDEIASGTTPEFARSLDAAIARFGTLLTSNLLGGLLALASLIFLPYFAVRWTFSPQAVIIDGKRNWAALDASSSIVKGQWWRTAGILGVIILIAIGPLLLASGASLLPVLPATIIISAVVAFVLPFVITAQTLLYYDLRARKQVAADVSPDRIAAP
ncbi:MAG: hypothetical protein M3P30_13520 [Chloroflexota bacterium]|nr:hypothetical protein [Chloroflexota bacterium]